MTTGFNVVSGGGTATAQPVRDITGGLGASSVTTRFVKGSGTTAILYQTTSNGYWLTTDDGVTWTKYATYTNTSDASNTAYFIEHDGTYFYAAGNSYMYKSSDGITWTRSTNSFYYSAECMAINGSTIVWCGSSGALWYSTNGGVNWTINNAFQTAVGYGQVRAIAYGNGYFVAVVGQYCMYSTDGITWTNNSSVYSTLSSNTLYSIAFGNGYFVIGATNGRMAYATNPTSPAWTESTSLRTGSWGTNLIETLRYVNGNFIALSDNGRIGYVASNPSSAWTYNGSLVGTESSLKDIKYFGGSYWLSMAKDYQYKSTDLTTFTGYYTISDSGYGGATVNAIAYSGSLYVVGGAGGKIATSTDGITWTYRNGLATTGWGRTATVSRLKWINNRFVAIAQGGQFATSTDGITWTYSDALRASTTLTNGLYDVEWNGSMYLAVGYASYFATSTDGITWTVNTSGISNMGQINVVLWVNNKWHIFGTSGYYSSSTNGTTWPAAININQSNSILSAVWTGSRFIVGGNNRYMATSANGTTWTDLPASRSQIPNGSIFNMIYINGQLIVYHANSLVAASWNDGNSWTSYSLSNVGVSYIMAAANSKVGVGQSYSSTFTLAEFPQFATFDADTALVRRDDFSTGSLWYWNDTTMSPVTAGGTDSTWKSITSSRGIYGIKSDGTLWTWGNNQAATPTQVSFAGYTNNDWKSFACGYQGPGAQESFMGVKTDGNIWAWGGNSFGQLGVGDSVNKSSPVTVVGGGSWKQVAMGTRTDYIGSTMGIKTDGTLWYMNVSPIQVAGGGIWKQVATNEGSIAIKTDGTMWAWSGTSSPTTWTAVGSKTWKYINASYRNTFAIDTSGSLWSTGNNSYGQLGDGTTTNRYDSFVSVAGGGTNWKSVFACGYWSTVVGLKTDGTLWSWGRIPGDGTSVTKSSPVLVAGGFTNWRSVPVGSGGPSTPAPIMMIQDLTI